MKVKRYKKVTKNIAFYVNNFGFRQPYQILVDGTFCLAALNNQVNIANDIPKYLKSEIKLITTQCAIIEMEKLGKKLTGALIILKNSMLRKCDHIGKPITASKCLISMVKDSNPKHFIISTQDKELQEKIRNIPGVPLLYLHSKVPILEQPSEASINETKKKMEVRSEMDLERIQKLKESDGLIEEEVKPFKKKKKKKGANPLSCQKKKKQSQTPINKKKNENDTARVKRKRNRIPQHVIDELFKNK